MTARDYCLLRFGADDVMTPAGDLARLHATLLPESPVSRLGHRFMEDFYYRVLPREGLVFGAVAYVDRQPAGFVAATHDRAGFMRSGMRRFWPRVLWVVGASVLTAPKSLGAVWQAWRVMRSRPAASVGLDGEILSLGVLPAYREPGFVRRSGLRIATDLLDAAVDRLRELGIPKITAAVRMDNAEAKLFYAGLGWTLHRASVQGGGPAALEFRWERNGAADQEQTPASSARR